LQIIRSDKGAVAAGKAAAAGAATAK
jgi:hypothetical protein